MATNDFNQFSQGRGPNFDNSNNNNNNNNNDRDEFFADFRYVYCCVIYTLNISDHKH